MPKKGTYNSQKAVLPTTGGADGDKIFLNDSKGEGNYSVPRQMKRSDNKNLPTPKVAVKGGKNPDDQLLLSQDVKRTGPAPHFLGGGGTGDGTTGANPKHTNKRGTRKTGQYGKKYGRKSDDLDIEAV